MNGAPSVCWSPWNCSRRALVTILDEAPRAPAGELALLSEAALVEDWSRPEEDAVSPFTVRLALGRLTAMAAPGLRPAFPGGVCSPAPFHRPSLALSSAAICSGLGSTPSRLAGSDSTSWVT
jgi:hypothetical protein